MSIEAIEKEFIRNFIRKERRERSLLILRSKTKRAQFLDKFNHHWTEMIAEKNLIKVNTKSDQETFSFLKDKLGWNESERCYVISYGKNDGQLLSFKEAFENCQASGYAGLIVGKNGRRFYLKTEQVKGAPDKFIGIRKNP